MESVRDLTRQQYKAAKRAAISGLRSPNSVEVVTSALLDIGKVRTMSPAEYRHAKQVLRRALRDK